MHSSTAAVDEWVQRGGGGINLPALNSDYINTPIIFGVLSKSFFFSQNRERFNYLEKDNAKVTIDLNEFKNIQLLDAALGRVIDRGKYNKRETRMLDKINKNILKEGNILVLCGTLHVPFLKKNMKEAFLLADIR